MKEFIKYLFTTLEDKRGVLSTMRVIVFIIALTGCGSEIYLIIRGGVTLTESGLVLGVIGAALTAKVVQKNIESKEIDESKLDV